MNIKTILSVAFVGALIFTSCKNETAEVEQMPEENATEMPASDMVEPMESDMQPTEQPVQEAPSAMQQNNNVTPLPTPAPATSQRLNPEHGMPGHRCDIAVGAPL